MTGAVAQNDQNVKIPAAVKAAAARADDVYKQAYQAPQDGTADVNGDTSGAPIGAPAGDDPGVAAAAGQSQAEGTPATAPPVTPPVTPPGNPEGTEPNWEHQYKSMKGRYDRLQSDFGSLQAQIIELQRAPAPPAAQPSSERLVTPQEEQDYGAEFLQVVGRKAKEEFLPDVTKIQSQLSDLERRLSSVSVTTAVSARDRLVATMDEQVPAWQDINNDPKFLSWLGLPDPYSGAIRLDLLRGAFENNQSSRVLAFFNGFLAEEAAVAPGEPGPDLLPVATPASKVPLVSLAAPGRAKSAAASAPAEKPLITRADVAAFYTAVAAGRYRGKEAEKDQLEAQIFEAERNGRIR